MTETAFSRLKRLMSSRPLRGITRLSLEAATKVILNRLYQLPTETISQKTLPQNERNELIRSLYANGDGLSIPKLAEKFGISNARIHQIIHGKRK